VDEALKRIILTKEQMYFTESLLSLCTRTQYADLGTLAVALGAQTVCVQESKVVIRHRARLRAASTYYILLYRSQNYRGTVASILVMHISSKALRCL
jgi:hypothetical protein